MNAVNRAAILLASVLLPLFPLCAQKKTIGIGGIEVTPALKQSAKKSGSLTEMNRVVQAMDGQLVDRIHNTRKFKVFARGDLDKILEEQGFAESGNVDMSDPRAAKAFKLGGVQYLLVTTVSDFQDYHETATFEGIGKTVKNRVIRLGAVAKIYDTTSGALLESANFQIDTGGKKERENFIVSQSGELSDQFLMKLARMMAGRVANRVADVIYPAKIIGKIDQQVTINRGDGTEIESGQIWDVYALGEKMVDPDTGEVLGQNEVKVGSVKIMRVEAKMSYAEILDDYGINKLQVVRRRK